MLTDKLCLHDVRDTEALAIHVVRTSSRFRFSPSEREDLTAYLIATCWELSTRYEPGAVSFTTWVTAILKLRVIDWVRGERGRTRWRFGNGTVHERERPIVDSLDDELAGLDDLVASRAGDPQDGRSPDLARVFAAGDRQRARDLETLGLAPPRRAR